MVSGQYELDRRYKVRKLSKVIDMRKKSGITLFLMTKKGYSVLENIVLSKNIKLIDKVVIGLDGKVLNDYSSGIREICVKNSIPYEFRSENVQVRTEYAIAVSWKWIIRTGAFRLIVLHDSLLPGYRGFAPLVSALKNGEKEAGVTAIYAEESYDTGEIIDQLKIKIKYPIRISTLIDRVSLLYDKIIIRLIKKIENGEIISGKKQDEKLASYSLWLDESDYIIDWSRTSEEILRFIDAVGDPYKGACSYLKNKRVRILSAEIYPDVKIENRSSGKIIFKDGIYPVVVCGSGLIKLTGITDDKYNDVLPLKELRLRFTSDKKIKD
jgi:methionyl-tRNA formyltransferase